MKSIRVTMCLLLLGALACGEASEPEETGESAEAVPFYGIVADPSADDDSGDGAARPGGRRKKPRGPQYANGDVIPPELHKGDGSARMVARLQELNRTAEPEIDRALNDRRVTMFEERIKESLAAGRNAQQLRFQLVSDKVGAGRSQEGADELTAMLAKLDASAGAVKPQFHMQVLQMLAVAWLRLGEQGNCILHHGSDSCLMPIPGGGRHVDELGSRKALDVLRRILEEEPADYGARWLLNVAAMTLGEWPHAVEASYLVPPSAFESDQDIGRFVDVAPAAGLADRGLAGGVCQEDFDGDGLLDIVTSDWSLERPMQYYRNDGNGRFTDRSAEAGFTGMTGALNIIHADIDNDGDADIIVPRGAWKSEAGARYPLSLLQNDGHGVFRDVTEEAGLLCFLSSQAVAVGDYDGDGWLDLFVGSETARRKDPSPCRLFRNDGDGTFTDVSAASGVDLVAYVKGCSWGDFDNDGDPDLVVTRMDGPPLLYRNDAGRFTDVAAASGIVGPEQSFPTWWFDFDNDGLLDIYLSGYRISNAGDVCKDYLGLPHDGVTPRLYRNLGDGRFDDVTTAYGLNHVLPAMGANWGDLDNDGWPDLYLATGEPDLRGVYPNRLFRNDAGRRFVDITTSAGMGHLQKGHGVAFGDLDNDGDQDVFAVMGGALSGDDFHRVLFENPGHDNAWITLLLQGTRSNRSAIGARLVATVRGRTAARAPSTTSSARAAASAARACRRSWASAMPRSCCRSRCSGPAAAPARRSRASACAASGARRKAWSSPKPRSASASSSARPDEPPRAARCASLRARVIDESLAHGFARRSSARAASPPACVRRRASHRARRLR